MGSGEVVAICGCGGKTTLLWGLARHFRQERVLVTTSTKIGRPAALLYDSVTDAREVARLAPPNPVPPGVHLAGTLFEDRTHVKSLPLEDLGALRPNFDKTLIEADGSRLLPVKGWDAHEPVIPEFVTLTVGVATVWAEGRPVDDNTVHRPHIFCRLTGARLGEPLTLAHLAAAAARPQGLMHRARGRKILLINQLDDAAALRRAREFVNLLPQSFLQSLEAVIGASLEQGRADLLYRGA